VEAVRPVTWTVADVLLVHVELATCSSCCSDSGVVTRAAHATIDDWLVDWRKDNVRFTIREPRLGSTKIFVSVGGNNFGAVFMRSKNRPSLEPTGVWHAEQGAITIVFSTVRLVVDAEPQ
jgi:hypothetical protein